MRRVITLLLLLVILGVFGGVLIVFHEKVHDTAGRVQCQNNLRQVGLALYGHHDNRGHFPPGTMPNPDLPPEKRLSWCVITYAYVEANQLYSRTDKEAAWDAENNHFAAIRPMLVYQCPAVSPLQEPVSGLAPTTYIGIAGIGMDAATLPKEDPRAGFFGYDREVGLADLKGRTSTLLVLAETARTSGSWIAGGPDTVRGLEHGSRYLGREGQFGGLHRAGTNVLFAGGSVRFLAIDTGPEVLDAMARLHGE
jgi:hypothetical protein